MPTTEHPAVFEDTLALARALIRRPSVTPDDAGCQVILAEQLEALGFHCEHLRFGCVDNLWARLGSEGPVFAFAGHTDVVPTGDLAAWRRPPFEAAVDQGVLYGRGAADMKSSLAAMITGTRAFLERCASPRGSIAFLITSDEEGPAVDGTAKVIEALRARGEFIEWCLVGEPSSQERLGDVVRVGRRGSLNATLRAQGIQGHVAYPETARNPIHAVLPALTALVERRWDRGNAYFPPTSFQISNMTAGTGATNVIPGECEVQFNFRFSTEQSDTDLRQAVHTILDTAELDYALEWHLSGTPFLTRSGALVEAVRGALQARGVRPELSTGGGTSDGRFIAPNGAEVVELGPCNATIHQVDEHIHVAELDALAEIYAGVLDALLAS